MRGGPCLPLPIKGEGIFDGVYLGRRLRIGALPAFAFDPAIGHAASGGTGTLLPVAAGGK